MVVEKCYKYYKFNLMITKTYLDGKLNQLEEKIKRTIDVKDNRQTEELSAEIKELRNSVKLLEEKVAENRDVLENYLKENNAPKKSAEELKSEPEDLKQPVENFKEAGNAEDFLPQSSDEKLRLGENAEDAKKKDDDVITSDI
jgi:uncharacterized coiled-coil DUF342 family protein